MKRYVLTGGPGSGKSSILVALELKGHQVIREAAEDYIKYQQALGVKEPWLEEDFQEKIFWLQRNRETISLLKDNPYQPVFIDRGLYDNYAYEPEDTKFYKELETFLLGKGRKTSILRELGTTNTLYTKVFLIEHPGSIESNEVRRENVDQALFLEKKLEEIYKTCRYEVVRIPFLPLEDRVKEIIKHTG